MKTPLFWYTQNPTFFDKIKVVALWPFSLIYRVGLKIRRLIAGYPYNAKIPIICIGNIHAGGTGKTPFVYALAHYFSAIKQKRVVIITRGYRRKTSGQFIVDVMKHTTSDVGDEAWMLAHKGMGIYKVMVMDNRVDAVQSVEYSNKDTADLIIFDDGLQDPSVNHDLKIVVMDEKLGMGNGHVIPAGPLRESCRHMEKIAHMLAVVRKNAHNKDFQNFLQQSHLPLLDLTPDVCFLSAETLNMNSMEDLQSRDFIAFAGIGIPNKFFDQLRDKGFNLVDTIALEDHQHYNQELEKKLLQQAATKKAMLVTTEKDFVKLSHEMQQLVVCSKLEIALEHEICDVIEDMVQKNYRQSRQAFLPA